MILVVTYDGQEKPVASHPQETMLSLARRSAKFFGLKVDPKYTTYAFKQNGKLIPGKRTLEQAVKEFPGSFELVNCLS